MPGTTTIDVDTPLTEVSVQIPTDRVATFYAFLGEWLRSPDGSLAPRTRASGRRRTAGSSKYDPIGAHLASLEDDAVTLGFDEIEELTGSRLPASAHKHRAWWANTETHTQALAWIRNGWIVSEADLEAGAITFARG